MMGKQEVRSSVANEDSCEYSVMQTGTIPGRQSVHMHYSMSTFCIQDPRCAWFQKKTFTCALDNTR